MGNANDSELVLHYLKEHGSKLDQLNDKITEIQVQIGILKTKAIYFGAGAGLLVATLITTVAEYIIK